MVGLLVVFDQRKAADYQQAGAQVHFEQVFASISQVHAVQQGKVGSKVRVFWAVLNSSWPSSLLLTFKSSLVVRQNEQSYRDAQHASRTLHPDWTHRAQFQRFLHLVRQVQQDLRQNILKWARLDQRNKQMCLRYRLAPLHLRQR